MNLEDSLRLLLPVLYATPLDSSNWQIFLDRLSQMTEISSGYLISSDLHSGNLCLAAGGPNYDPAPMALYNEQYGTNDPFRQGFLMKPRTGLIDGDELVAKNDLMRTEIWNELLSPYDLHHVTMLCGRCEDTSIETLSLWRDSKQGPLSSASIQLLQALAPHVKTALHLNSRLHLVDSCRSLAEAALDALETMIVIVDRTGRVQHLNRLAAQRLGALVGIGIRSGTLVASDAVENAQLQALLQRATAEAGRKSLPLSGGAMKIRRPDARTDVQLSVLPASEHPGVEKKSRSAIIFIGEPDAALRSRGDLLRELYRLTATESRLADCLLQGNDLRDAAERLTITWATARFHLKRVFAKTGTRRQSELMRLMLTLPAPPDQIEGV